MNIGGLQAFSLSDFPGCVAAVAFTQGCNFRCPYCHNSRLVPMTADPSTLFPVRDVVDFLEDRKGRLDGIVVSGGEPTLQADLADFLRTLKAMGFAVKLDTNGSNPESLQRLVTERLLDYIAMDFKAPWMKYDRLTGIVTPIDKLKRSMGLIVESGIPHEFRTTRVEALLDEDDIAAIGRLVPEGSQHVFLDFRPEHAADPALRGTKPDAQTGAATEPAL